MFGGFRAKAPLSLAHPERSHTGTFPHGVPSSPIRETADRQSTRLIILINHRGAVESGLAPTVQAMSN
jgi:hypothetical protein